MLDGRLLGCVQELGLAAKVAELVIGVGRPVEARPWARYLGSSASCVVLDRDGRAGEPGRKGDVPV